MEGSAVGSHRYWPLTTRRGNPHVPSAAAACRSQPFGVWRRSMQVRRGHPNTCPAVEGGRENADVCGAFVCVAKQDGCLGAVRRPMGSLMVYYCTYCTDYYHTRGEAREGRAGGNSRGYRNTLPVSTRSPTLHPTLLKVPYTPNKKNSKT